MNKERRKKLQDIANQIEYLTNVLSDISVEEQDYRDNMPENLQGSERYEKADEAIDNIDSAMDSLNEAREYIESAME